MHQGKKNWLFEVCKQPKPLVPISWSSCCPAEEVRAVAMVLVTLVGKSVVCNPPRSGLILPSGQEVFVWMAASASWGWGGRGQLWVMSADGQGERGLYIARWMDLGVLSAGQGRNKCRRTGESVKHPCAQLPCFFWINLAAHQIPLLASEKIWTQAFCYFFLKRTALPFLLVLPQQRVMGSIPSGQLSTCTFLGLTGQLWCWPVWRNMK